MALNIENYALQYGNVVLADVAAANLDLFITGADALNAADAASLIAGGTKVIAYVNACVTDHYKPYWNPAWTVDGTDNSAVLPNAPSWLKTNVTNSFGVVVNYADPAWRKIVIDQAKDLVTQGYSGIFLDDVGTYFAYGQGTGNFGEAARAMLTLVVEVKAAITAINPNAVVVVNGSPYIISDTVGGPSSPEAQAFLAAADAMMAEVYFGMNRPAENIFIEQAKAVIKPSMPILALEYGGTPYQNRLFLEDAAAQGFIGAVAVDASYTSLGAPVASATEAADTLTGTERANSIFALGGNDTVNAGGGNDVVTGGAGDDTLNGGDGNDKFVYTVGNNGLDTVSGGNGTDTIDLSSLATTGWVDLAYSGVEAWTYASGAWQKLADTTSVENIVGTATADRLWGDALANRIDAGAGIDQITGRAGNDVLNGGDGADRFYYLASNNGLDTVDGGAGADTIDFSALATAGWIDLAYSGTEAWTLVSGAWQRVAEVVSVENIVGTTTGDQFWGNADANLIEGKAGSDKIDGRAGNDTLNGGSGNDIMTGGIGTDSFRFSDLDMGTDRITDFADGTDKISLALSLETAFSGLTITGNGTTSVMVTGLNGLGNVITVQGTAPITLDVGDFIFTS